MRLVDADALLEVIGGYCDDREGLEEYVEESILQSHELYDLGYKEGYKDAKMPTVDAEPRHGKWIKISEFMPIYCCSECKERNLFDSNCNNVLSDHCPNCGAKMDGEG